MTTIVTLDLAGFRAEVGAAEQEVAVRAIEEGGVLMLPKVRFVLAADEYRFLTPEWSDGRTKNISVEMRARGAATGDAASAPRIKGARGAAEDLRALTAMVTRFAVEAGALVGALFPRYAPYVQQARTSFRPAPAAGRDVSWRKDDSRLHVDAFPSRPNLGARILRVFTNVNPVLPRVWRVGEPFETMARTLLPGIPALLPGSAAVLSALHVTKGRHSQYDHLMLQLHDRAKADLDYQRDCTQQ
ncbi:MAG: Kdo hydroxylase family protein, partial [Casimicrobiaceae bacterium]